MLKQTCHTINIRENGVTLVRGFFRYPSLEQNDLYTELAKNAEAWLRSSLVPKAAQEYAQDPSAKKQFFFSPYEYRFEVTPLSQSESDLTLKLTVTLTRRQSGEAIAHHESVERFRLPDLTLRPAKKR